MVKIILQPPATTPQAPSSRTAETPSAAQLPFEVSSDLEQVGVTLKRMLVDLMEYGDMLASEVQPRRTTHKQDTQNGK